jgi:spore germination cell wall hydrolase CwlJ-like protein
MAPRINDDPDIKKSEPSAATADPGTTVAGKGEVTGEGRRPKTPAERLGLSGAKRTKAEKCLANAVYFEARSEPVRGQIAVAQVVMNRAFSGYYPSDVCGVVYQNAHRHLACQFTFACDGIADVVTDQDSWHRAKRIARETLDGKLWLSDVGKSTHYHASYVRPWWVRAMHKLAKIGMHNFYRPRKWGDGSDEPSWGSAAYTASAAAKM